MESQIVDMQRAIEEMKNALKMAEGEKARLKRET